jgi:tyrosyl-tRNA synthetase
MIAYAFPIHTTFNTHTLNTLRTEDNGGDVTYTTYEALRDDFVANKLHPSDLKPAVTMYINQILQPVRDHFASGEPKKLLQQVRKFKVTR